MACVIAVWRFCLLEPRIVVSSINWEVIHVLTEKLIMYYFLNSAFSIYYLTLNVIFLTVIKKEKPHFNIKYNNDLSYQSIIVIKPLVAPLW